MTTTMKEPRVHHAHREYSTLLRSNRNVGGWERAARLFLGSALLAVAFTAGPAWVRAILAVLGTVGILTSVAAYCPLNRALGRDSYHHGDLR